MDQKDSMTASQYEVKKVTLRWPDPFWEIVSIAATKRRTSVQALVTEAVAEKLGIAVPGDVQTEPPSSSSAA